MLSRLDAHLRPSPGESRAHIAARFTVSFVVGTLMIAALMVIGGLILLLYGLIFSAFSWLPGWLGGMG